jgi:hypothetical protein
MESPITSQNEYQLTMDHIFDLMNKGEHALSEVEFAKLSAMAIVAEQYEKDMITPS